MGGTNQQSPIAIIGAGPGGIAAAIQLKRFGLEPLVFEKNEIGGLLRNAHWVENYPGFTRGISGQDLVANMKAHLNGLNIPVLSENVRQLDFDKSDGIFNIITDDAEYRSRFVVAATGTRPCRLSQADGLADKLPQKIFYEVVHIQQCSHKHIVIVGAGDAAFDYALNLTRSGANRVTVIYRGTEIKALPLLYSRCLNNANIHLRERHHIVSIRKGELDNLALMVERPEGVELMECDYLLAAVGREAKKDYFSPRLIDLEAELIMRDLLHLVGDVKNGLYRQASIAVGNGIETAMRLCSAMKE